MRPAAFRGRLSSSQVWQCGIRGNSAFGLHLLDAQEDLRHILVFDLLVVAIVRSQVSETDGLDRCWKMARRVRHCCCHPGGTEVSSTNRCA